jgi:glycosyltransferase involved in cell wall biosynthesis
MPKIALIHDYLREYGGAERVLEELHEMFPEAPVYTAFVDKKSLASNWQRFSDWDIRQTCLGKILLIKKIFSPLRILAARAFAKLDLSDFDIVISSSNAYMAKAARATKNNAKHFCYCHTPPRVLYGYSAKSQWRERLITRFFGELINHHMRFVDFKTAQEVGVFIANSLETQARIKKFYHRQSVVIHPPVTMVDKAINYLAEEKKFNKQGYYLYVNRLALAKHPEIAVQVASDLNLALKVVGEGDMLPKLKKMAGGSVEFLGTVDDQKLAELYRGAKALIYPVEDEDFGIVPIEAMAWGVPVLAHYSGGPRETLETGKTGVFFNDLSVEALKQAIFDFEKIDFDTKEIHQSSLKYAPSVFRNKIKELVLA